MKTIIITGAISGIGLETARVLTSKGFFVIGLGRSEANCRRAREDVLEGNPSGHITFFCADLMQQRDVLRVTDELADFLTEHNNGELYALINNAGCVRSWYTTTDEGYEQQFALNHLAGFLVTHRLLGYLRRGHGRVLMTSSESHKGIQVRWDDVMLREGYNPLRAYMQSKLCNILFARGLNDRFARQGMRAYVVDPGLVNTDIGNKATGSLVNLFWALRKRHGVSPQVPAATYAFLCEQAPAPAGLYYHLCREQTYSREVTRANADRLWALSERLCGIAYDMEVAA